MNKMNDKNRRDHGSNRLVHEKSPYLLQHANNPVSWYPWGVEAFETATVEDKPVFLSIGYSTCHWCHVMERESFEDSQVAELINNVFIPIKVDREERPDLDHIYMAVCQMLTGSGGWPLTILMTPTKEPFFAATYIPKEDRFGRSGLISLIPKIKEVWTHRRKEVTESSEKIVEALRNLDREQPGESLDRDVLHRTFVAFRESYDEVHGGFGRAPKFPSPHNLLFLLRYWKRSGEEKALQMVEGTLQAMRRGGIFDQVGKGFHRYSTDEMWLVPHFEKMLYDQALLAMAYLETFQATGKVMYGEVAQEIFTYVLRDMTSPEGGFYSAEDADSEGVEGKCYVWTEEDVCAILSKEEADFIMPIFGMAKEGNYRDESSGRRTGTNILHLQQNIAEAARQRGIGWGKGEKRIASVSDKLYQARLKRVPPYKDDKILVDWNGLMIAALAKGAQVFGTEQYAEAAIKASQFLLKQMMDSQGRLLHRYRDGEAAILAHLDDYAFLVWGLIELYEATFDAEFLKEASRLNADMLRRFWDANKGGLFFAAEDGEDLLVRKKESGDGAVPSGNSVAFLNLLRLARFFGSKDLEKKAGDMGIAFSQMIHTYPSGHSFFLSAFDFALGPSYEVVIVGDKKAEDTKAMAYAMQSRFVPNKVLLLKGGGDGISEMEKVTPLVRNRNSLGGRATAYVCSEDRCLAPTTDVREMLALVNSGGTVR
jgi:uncharacterized protein YyaL (SSP411 family)